MLLLCFPWNILNAAFRCTLKTWGGGGYITTFVRAQAHFVTVHPFVSVCVMRDQLACTANSAAAQ